MHLGFEELPLLTTWTVIVQREFPEIANLRASPELIIEALFKGPDDPDLEWMRRFIEFFGFFQAGHLEEAHGTQRGADSAWLDKFIWQHKATIDILPVGSDPGVFEAP